MLRRRHNLLSQAPMTITKSTITTSTFIKYIALFIILSLIAVNISVLQRRNDDESFLLSNMKNEFKKRNTQQQQPSREQRHSLLHEGRTLRDTLQRILSRKITASNVLIITPDAAAVLPADAASSSVAITTTTTSNRTNVAGEGRRTTSSSSSGAGLLISEFANKEGHAIHCLHPHMNVDLWWENDHDRKNQNWFLLAFVSDGKGDLFWNHIRKNNNNNQTTVAELDIGIDDNDNVDHLMNSVNVFLKEATVTYLILEVGVLPASSSFSNNNSINYHNGGNPKIIGRHAVQILHNFKYKVQILVNSHLFMTTTTTTAAKWGPNTLLTPYNIDEFFVDAANLVSITGEPFQSYFFATQGLDLAIPFSSRGGADSLAFWEYYDDTANTKSSSCSDDGDGSGGSSSSMASMLSNSKDCGNGNCGIYANIGLGIRPSCPPEHSKAEIEFVSNNNRRDDIKNNSYGLKLMYDNKIITSQTEGVTIWLNDMENPELAEAACMRIESNGSPEMKQPSVSCTTRIIKQQIPQQQSQETKQNEGSASKPTSSSFNVLSILIDPISRTQFLRSLPRTAALLEAKQFVRFDKYTVVGANSGPNQAALFSGVPLMHGRNGISSSASHGNGDNQPNSNARKTQWIWDELRSSGFVTFKAEDGCIENSNMIQSLSPNVTHGSALHQMFCFSFDRPNCLGGKLAATHLLETAAKFIDAYSTSGEDRWAAFLSFTDSHEDSLSMIQILDDVLFDFISNLDTSNTLVMVLSDHGLHYGPHFQTPAGVKERAQPVLYMRLPDQMHSLYAETLQENSNLWTSHFDVHETILEVALGKADSEIIGSSLLHPLPSERNRCYGVRGIPSEYCDVVDKDEIANAANTQLVCMNIPTPPSPLTFLADLPIHSHLKCDQGTEGLKFSSSLPHHLSANIHNLREVKKQPRQMLGSCKCATDTTGWNDCQRHPWNNEEYSKGGIALTFCHGDSQGGDLNDINSNAGFVEVDIGIPAMSLQGPKSRRLADSNQFLQRQMLCADSIVSNLRVNSPPPVSFRIHSS